MASASSAKRTALVVIAQRGFQDVELAGTTNGLTKAGFGVTLASKDKGKCVGKFDGVKEASLAMRDVDPSGFDRCVFIGGPGAGALAKDDEALALARKFSSANKVIGAICVAPTILAAAGLLKGKKATTWTDDKKTQVDLLKKGEATYVPDKAVVVDAKIVTGNGPDAADEFGDVFARCE